MNAFGRIIVILLVCLMATGCGSSAGTTTATASAPAISPPTVTQTTTATASNPTVTATPPAPSATAAVPITATTPAASTNTPTSPAATPTAALTATAPQASATTAVPQGSVRVFPDPSAFTWTEVASGVTRPSDIVFIPDNTGRYLVTEQVGKILLFQNNQLVPTPFLDISGRVGSTGNEQGLLGIALHPKYLQNGYFYVNYTDTNGNTVIARFTVSPNDPNRADPNSEKDLLHVQQPFANHNGGSMAFGPDGYLYLGLGDGGSEGDPLGNGQSTATDLGKLLRIDVDHGDPYAIPATNPFVKGGGKPEIWAYGLRNPWRFSFDRLTGDLYIGDVGQNLWEEIDYLPANTPGGVNFGWKYREGKHPYQGNPPASLHLTDPVYDYSHAYGCAVTGGYVYRGITLPAFRGIYLFSDYCSGRIWGLLRGADGTWQAQQLYQGQWNITSFGQDNNGEIYFLDQSSGGIFKLQRK